MDVLLISTFPPRRCGIGDNAADFAAELAKHHDVEVSVLTYEDGLKSGTSSQNGFEILRELEGRTTPKRMASLLKRLEPGLVHLQSSSFLHHPSVNTSVARACVSPLITTVHNAPRSWRIFYTIPGLREVYKKSSRLITHSEGVSRTLSEFHSVEATRIARIPLGVDTDKYNPHVNGNEVRRRYDLEDTRIVLFFGFLRRGKGLETLLKAWSRVESSNRDSILVIAGGIPTQPRKYAFLARSEAEFPLRLKELSNRIDIAKRTLFTGYVPERLVAALLTSAELVVLPYDGNHSQSDALHKALSCGKPVVAARVSGFEELLEDGRHAILFTPRDVESLANSIDLLLSDSRLSQRLGRNARRLAEEQLTLCASVEKTLEVYSDSLN